MYMHGFYEPFTWHRPFSILPPVEYRRRFSLVAKADVVLILFKLEQVKHWRRAHKEKGTKLYWLLPFSKAVFHLFVLNCCVIYETSIFLHIPKDDTSLRREYLILSIYHTTEKRRSKS